jgi:hypothetical protein
VGEHDVVISLKSGWTSPRAGLDPHLGNCELLRQRVTVIQPEGFNTLWILVGCLVSAAVIVIALVGIVYKFSERFKHFFQTLVFEAGRQILTFCLEGADIATDSVSFYRGVPGVVADSLQGAYQLTQAFKIAYSCVFAIATVASTLSLANRGYQGWKLLKAVLSHGDSQSESAHVQEHSPKDAMLVRLRWEAEKSKRDIIGNLMTLLTVVFEDAPFAVLNGILIFAKDVGDKWVRVCSCHNA